MFITYLYEPRPTWGEGELVDIKAVLQET